MQRVQPESEAEPKSTKRAHGRKRPNPKGADVRLGVGFAGAQAGFERSSSVEPGSLGEQVGFETGDRLLSLNGQSMDSFDVAALGSMIRSVEPLIFEIERRGEPITVKVP